MKPMLAVLTVISLIATGRAVNSLDQEYTCPIDGTVWKQRVETSANPKGQRLDLRQFGDVEDPPTLPQCPKCRFPLFSDQIPPAAVERLRPFVQGADYQMFAAKNPSYFSLAQVQEFLRAPHRYIAYSYLRASWQVEDRELVCRRFLEKALQHFALTVAEMKPEDPKIDDMALICGEVERRLGKWDDAEKRFRRLQSEAGLKDGKMKPIVAMQLKLIELRDSRPRSMADNGKDPAPTVRTGQAVSSPSAPKPEGLQLELELPVKGSNSEPYPLSGYR